MHMAKYEDPRKIIPLPGATKSRRFYYMKKISKLLSILLCLAMLLSFVPAIASAAASGSLSFSDPAKRTEMSADKQVWVDNGITFTNAKAESANDVKDYSAPVRLYKGSTATIAFSGIETVVFTCNNESYATALVSSLTGTEYTVAQDGKVVTVTMKAAANSLTFACGAQIRLDSIAVNEKPAAPETPVAPTNPKEIVDAAFALASGAALPYEATLSGTITAIDTPYSEQYGNISVVINVEGTTGTKSLLCYRIKGEGAATLAVGDTITVKGSIKNYNGTIEFDAGSTITAVVKGQPGEAPKVPQLPELTDGTFTKVDTVVAGEYVIIAEYNGKFYALSYAVESKKVVATEVTVANGSVTGKLPVWNIAEVTGGVTLKAGEAYLECTGSTNVGHNFEAYTWSFNAEGMLVPSTQETRALSFRLNQGNAIFGTYAQSNASGQYAAEYSMFLQFYKLNNGTSAPETPDKPVDPPKTGDTISVAIAMLVMGAMGTVALISKKH